MNKLRNYLNVYFELFFVLLVLVSTASIYHFIDQRLAFLNFFFLPVILSAYYLGVRKAVLGTIFITLLVSAYVVLDPEKFLVRYNYADLYLHLTVWSCFLLLSAAVVGSQKEKLEVTVAGVLSLNSSLQEKQQDLNSAHLSLKGYTENLEGMVRIRTEELEASRAAIEQMKEKVESALYSTIDSSVAKLLIEGRIRSDKRQISIMFADLVGFTSYSEERSPEIVVGDVNRFLAKMEPILSNFHGHLDKFLGDGIMCQFGAPINFDNYRLLAVLTALKMQEAIDAENFPWSLRIGIASGTAITGLIGVNRQSYTSIGDVVNVAARLESRCPGGEIVVDEDTHEGCKKFFDTLPFHLQAISESEIESRSQVTVLQEEISMSSDPRAQGLLYYVVAGLQVELGDVEDAIRSYELAIKLTPENQQAKIAMAEVVIARQNQGVIQIKGRKKAVKAFSIVRLKDPLNDFDRIPESFGLKFRDALSTIAIPDSLPLRVEALDGSIGHSTIVAFLSYAIATKLSIFDQENFEIMIAGYTADLGKEIVPHHLLNSKGVLTATEMTEIYKHPMESVRMLKNLGYNSPGLLDIVANSHERLDGSGYPRGIKGDLIPLGSRIVSVADTYAAMTSWRPYREKWDRGATVDELMRLGQTGKLDAMVVGTLAQLLNESATAEREFGGSYAI